MITTGLIRRLDDLGRIVIPRSVRELAFGTNETSGKELEIFYEKDGTIILKPRDENKCPLGGDITDDCADCVYSGDYHYVNGECVRRTTQEKKGK